MQEQRALIQRELDATVSATLCVEQTPAGQRIIVGLTNEGAGHSWPSGSSPDRRAWVHVAASFQGQTVFESGGFANGPSLTDPGDINLWLLRDCLFDESDASTHAFWSARAFVSNQLLGPQQPTAVISPSRAVHRYFPNAEPTLPAIDEVHMEVKLRAIGNDILGSLVEDGLLEQSSIEAMPTFTLSGTVLRWSKEKAKPLSQDQSNILCVSSSNKPQLGTAAQTHRDCVR